MKDEERLRRSTEERTVDQGETGMGEEQVKGDLRSVSHESR